MYSHIKSRNIIIVIRFVAALLFNTNQCHGYKDEKHFISSYIDTGVNNAAL